MDPNESLNVLRTFCTLRHLVAPNEWKQVANEALDAFEALDGWLRSGGFLPTAWANAQSARYEAADEGDWDDVSRCPACGSPMDYCQGHGVIGDPRGHNIIAQHDVGDHLNCHPEGCDDEGVDLS